MALISSKQIDFSYGISGTLVVTGSFVISGSLDLEGAASASLAYMSASGNIVGNTGSFNYINISGDIAAETASFGNVNLTGDITLNDIIISGDVTTALSASSFTYIDSNQKLKSVTPTDGQILFYTGSQFAASNIVDGGSY